MGGERGPGKTFPGLGGRDGSSGAAAGSPRARTEPFPTSLQASVPPPVPRDPPGTLPRTPPLTDTAIPASLLLRPPFPGNGCTGCATGCTGKRGGTLLILTGCTGKRGENSPHPHRLHWETGENFLVPTGCQEEAALAPAQSRDTEEGTFSPSPWPSLNPARGCDKAPLGTARAIRDRTRTLPEEWGEGSLPDASAQGVAGSSAPVASLSRTSGVKVRKIIPQALPVPQSPQALAQGSHSQGSLRALASPLQIISSKRSQLLTSALLLSSNNNNF